jgi:hypothetical protein
MTNLTHLKTASLLSMLPCGELFCWVRNFEEMYLKDKIKDYPINSIQFQTAYTTYNFKRKAY